MNIRQAFETDVSTVSKLITAIEMPSVDMSFWGMVGPPMAYFEISNGEAPVTRLLYESIALTAEGTAVDCEAELCARMWTIFLAARAVIGGDIPALLFWRYSQKMILEDQSELGICRLRTRVVIPGVSLARLV